MKHQQGFTIVELIIVVIVAAVLAAIAAPNLSEFVKNNARATRINTMVTALNFARGQAVTRNSRVSICRSNTAFDDCAGVGDGSFEGGWIVFIDGGARGGVVAGDDNVVRVFQPDMGGVATLIASNGGGLIEGISYEANGLGWDLNPPAGATAVTDDTYFVYCDDRGVADARAIRISATGYPNLETDVAGLGLGCP